MKDSSNNKKAPSSAPLYLAKGVWDTPPSERCKANGSKASENCDTAQQLHRDSDKVNHRLNTVKVGQRAVISAIKRGCPSDLLHKLLSMGIVAGTEVKVTQRGFFGSPINIHLFGSVLSLRSAEAAQIQVTPI